MSDSYSESVRRAVRELGDPNDWTVPTGYPNSLALCVMDAIWSIGVRYQAVINVLNAYRRRDGERSPATLQDVTDGPQEFLTWYVGFPESDRGVLAAKALGNSNRVSSSKGSPLKVEAVARACQLLADRDVVSTRLLVDRADQLKPLWLSMIPGQRSGISWRYVLMLAGHQGVKPDRMIGRFMARMGATGVDAQEFVESILRAMENDGVTPVAVDHRMWTIERSFGRRSHPKNEDNDR